MASTAPGCARGATQATPTKPLNGFWDIGESGASEGRNINLYIYHVYIVTARPLSPQDQRGLAHARPNNAVALYNNAVVWYIMPWYRI